MHPVFFAAIGGALIALLALAIAWFVRSWAVKAVMVLLAGIFLVPAGYLFVGLNPWLVDARFRTYRAFYRDIDVGMTREQVLAALTDRYPANGPRQRPKTVEDTPENLCFFMNPESSREPNCEGIFLTLEGGRVVKKAYSPD